MNNTLIIASFGAGLLPILIFLVLYGLRTRWNESPAGRFLFGMAFTTVISYGLSLLTLMFPGYFNDNHGELIRIIVRFLLAGVSWSLLIVFFRAQNSGRRKRRFSAVDDERKMQ